jgi:phosphoglycolate phosphatase
MKYKIAIFDLDGTLLDTLQDLADSTNFALDSFGYPMRTTEEIRRFVGNGVAKLIERAVPDGTSPQECSHVLKVFKTHYADHCEDHTAPYEGVVALLDRLIEMGLPIAVVSNKIDFAVQTLCKKYFGDRVSTAVGEREGIRRKPYPDSVLEVLGKANIDPADAVYIGDSEVDVETAENAGTDVVCVTWGFRDKDFLVASGAKKFVDSASELLSLLIRE